MNKISKESIELSDKDLAAVSGGKWDTKRERKQEMPPIFISGKPIPK